MLEMSASSVMLSRDELLIMLRLVPGDMMGLAAKLDESRRAC